MNASVQAPEGIELDPQKARKLQDVAQESPRHVETFRKAFEGKSLRAAINAHCVECVGYDAREIRGCTVRGCPLYEVRPHREAST